MCVREAEREREREKKNNQKCFSTMIIVSFATRNVFNAPSAFDSLFSSYDSLFLHQRHTINIYKSLKNKINIITCCF